MDDTFVAENVGVCQWLVSVFIEAKTNINRIESTNVLDRTCEKVCRKSYKVYSLRAASLWFYYGFIWPLGVGTAATNNITCRIPSSKRYIHTVKWLAWKAPFCACLPVIVFDIVVNDQIHKLTFNRHPVISCVTKASACHHTLHANHWHCLWNISPIIAVKTNVTTSIKVLRFVVNLFYCGRVAFTVFKHADIKGVRQRLTSTATLDDGYCEATIPVVKGHHVT